MSVINRTSTAVKAQASNVFDWLPNALLPALVMLAGAVAGWIGHRIVYAMLERFFRQVGYGPGELLLKHFRRVSRYAMALTGAWIGLILLHLPDTAEAVIGRLMYLGWVLAIVWAGVRLVEFAEEMILERTGETRSKRFTTQLKLAKRITYFILGVVGLALVLLSGPRLRSLGTSILASAGVMGIVAGVALQQTLGNVFAGLQIAMSRPVDLGDVVVMEGEWGRVEEITLTYVVVRTWDKRAVILPISHLIQKPFQNWSRKSEDILGSVFLYADYTLPVDKVRERLREIAEESDLWDGQVCGLQVTDTTDRAMQLRALVSARDPSKAWDLRCLVREKLVAYIQENFPDSLPKGRRTLEGKTGGNFL